jgi:hypothetical protein
MVPFPSRLTRLILAVVLSACLIYPALQGAGPPPAARDKLISRLIDQLRLIDKGDVGYTPTLSGSGFLPLGTSQPGALLLGGPAPAPSAAMRDLVGHGAAAVPLLIAHLNDKRATKITLKHQGGFGGMFFSDEYDWNARTTRQQPAGVNRDAFKETKHPNTHTVTVGDLCFVALGQIVNRHFNAVRYQPTAIIMVNSPTYSAALQKTIKKEWGKLTPASHKESLIRDFMEPDSEYRRAGAAVRLGYYYPEALEPLVLKQLAEPRYNVFKVHDLIRDRLYPEKDVKKRKALLAEFLKQEGVASRDGILRCLFEDLDLQIADEEARVSPPLNGKYKARACLMELFGYPRTVKSSDQPYAQSIENCTQARFIDAITFFHTRNIDQAARRMLHSTDEEYLVRACARYLAGRGADAEIRKYVQQRLKGAKGEKRKELLRLQEQIGWTPLHAAAEMGEEDQMEELIRKGADINVRAANGKTPLHIAAELGKFGVVRYLMKRKANPNVKDQLGLTPVQYAARNHFDTAVKTLLTNGAEASDILVACYAGRADRVAAFLKKDPTLVQMRTNWGDTPLHLAATLNQVKIAEVLLAQGADVNARDGGSKLTPLHLAATYSGSEMIRLLLKNKADRNAKNSEGKRPLEFARETPRDEGIVRLLEKP